MLDRIDKNTTVTWLWPVFLSRKENPLTVTTTGSQEMKEMQAELPWRNTEPGSPELDTVFQVWPHQRWGIGKGSPPSALHLMQPRTPFTFFAARAHCWLMFSLVSSRTPALFLQDCFPAGRPPARSGTWGCSSPGAGPCSCTLGSRTADWAC